MLFHFHCSKPAIAKSFRLARFGSRARLCRRSSAEVSARDLPANCKFAMEVLLVASRFDHLPSSLVADVEPNACIVTLRGYFVARMCSLGNCKLGHRRLDFQLCKPKGVCPRNLWLECVRRDMFLMVFAHWTCFEVFIDGKHDFKSVSGRVFCLYVCRTFGTYWNAWHDRLNRIYIIGSRVWSLDVLWPGMTTEPWFNFWLAAQFPFVALLSVCEADVNTIDD